MLFILYLLIFLRPFYFVCLSSSPPLTPRENHPPRSPSPVRKSERDIMREREEEAEDKERKEQDRKVRKKELQYQVGKGHDLGGRERGRERKDEVNEKKKRGKLEKRKSRENYYTVNEKQEIVCVML